MITDKILVFGKTSMIGRAIFKYTQQNNLYNFIFIGREYGNLLNRDNIRLVLDYYKPTYIINLLGYNGGITLNATQPADIFRNTIVLNMNVFEEAVHHNIKKVITPLTSCGYPYNREVLKEEEFLLDKPHPSVSAHGYARRLIFNYATELHKQYGNRFVFTIFNNNYGPNARYNEPDRLKVADALIQKFINAKRQNLPSLQLFGDGSPRRELIYCEDSAEALIHFLEHYEQYDLPINVGTGVDVSIRELATLIAQQCDFRGEILWGGGPNGQMKKLLDVTRMREYGFECKTNLEEGIKKTVEWYNQNYPAELHLGQSHAK